MSYLQEENTRLKRELQKERDKVYCEYCKGKGWIITAICEDECYKCKGEGRL